MRRYLIGAWFWKMKRIKDAEHYSCRPVPVPWLQVPPVLWIPE